MSAELDLDLDYISVPHDECGAFSNLSPESYRRLASASLALANRPGSSTFIRRLEAEAECAVEIYTAQFLFTISVWTDAISLMVESLDYANSQHLLFTGQDTEGDWQRLRFAANRLVV